MSTRSGILLIGPTGSGKTPLGEHLESHGLWGRRCVHFDFGANLRQIADDNLCRVPCPHAKRVGMSSSRDTFIHTEEHGAPLSPEELDVVVRSLRTGALLENENFVIARKILLAFLAERNIGADDLVVLNGLPRHAGQAEDLDSTLDVEAVVRLSCSPEVVFERIRTNAGGDRADRTDDDIESIKTKLDIFTKRTAPLLEHYRQHEARIETVDITATTTPKDIWEMLNNRKKGTWD